MRTTTTTTTETRETVRQARRLRHLERDARRLLRACGRFSLQYDSGATGAAGGHVAQAAEALQRAALHCERLAGIDDESSAGGGA